jgi:hypothetical protein
MSRGIRRRVAGAWVVAWASVAFGAVERNRAADPATVPTDDLSRAHLEAPGDARAVDPTTSRAPARRITGYGYDSVQVNVDANGQNIVGDAANEPGLAIDALDPSRLAIGWRQFDTIQSDFRQAGWGYSVDAGRSWLPGGVIEPGVFRSDPVLGYDADGNVFYYSLKVDGGQFTCQMFRSSDGGQSWSFGVPGLGGDKQWFEIDRTGGAGRGNTYCYWSPAAPPYTWATFARSTNNGASFDGPYNLPTRPLYGTVTVGVDGAVYVAGVPLDTTDAFVVCKSENAWDPGAWPTFTTTPVDLGGRLTSGGGPNPGGLLGQVWIASDHSGGATHGNLYVLASLNASGGDPLDIHLVRSTDGGATWSAPVRVNDDAPGAWQWFSTLSVAPDGRLDVSWVDTRNGVNYQWSQLYYAYSHDAGATWSPNIPITPLFNSQIGYPQQGKIGDYYDQISDLAAANLAYAATFNGEQDVYFVRLGDCNTNGTHDGLDLSNGTSPDIDGNQVPDECDPDCNSNGLPDGYDIQQGASLDCNASGVPDECELAGNDCNTNGVPDECDLAAGTSPDCNTNDIPDECDVADPAVDCNTNSVPDACDLAAGTSPDCNANGLPDECDLGSGTSPDCNTNGVPDECDLVAQPDGDCNTNGIPDACDVVGGGSADCNTNGVPDECDVALATRYVSGRLSPIGFGSPQTFLVDAPRDALTDVVLSFEAVGDFNWSTETTDVFVGGVPVGTILVDGLDCPATPDQDTLTVGRSVFNTAIAGGTLLVEIVPTGLVDPAHCQPQTWVSVTARYQGTPASQDVNGSGVPDECEKRVGDCDCDGRVTFSDIGYFVAALGSEQAWIDLHVANTGSPPTCFFMNADANVDGVVGFDDIEAFVSLLPGG